MTHTHAFSVIVLSFLPTKRMHSPRRKVGIPEGGWEWGGSFFICFGLIRLVCRLKRIVVHHYEDHGCSRQMSISFSML